MSHFFYIHGDMSGDPNWNKIGIALTPYSAVRARQKYTSKKFFLDHLYFGNFSHIRCLELQFKENFYCKSAKFLLNLSATEIYNIPQEDIISEVNKIIISFNLKIKKIKLTSGYNGTNSKNCPLGLPTEDLAYEYLQKIVENNFETAFEYGILNSSPKPIWNKFFYE